MGAMCEESAKMKWCPHVVASHTDPRRISRYDSEGSLGGNAGEPQHNCIGSACMAWRWADYMNANNEEHFRAAAPPGSVLGAPVGYCALHGVPQDEIEARP